ncbi:MAG: molybdopterin guanine dinucleotide synthesis [Pseudomonadota bacterium]
MSLFDTHIAVDWSGGNDRGARPKKDAIWVGVAGEAPRYFRNRQCVEAWLMDRLTTELAAQRRVLAGFDFAFGYPSGFARHLTGSDDPLAVWRALNRRIEDSPSVNNRFDVAASINATLPGIGPFWGNALRRDIDDLPRLGRARSHMPFEEKRVVERAAHGAFSVWQLAGAGAVGSQVLMGLPVLERLREAFCDRCAVWPFQPLDRQFAFVEIWPSLWNAEVSRRARPGSIKDAIQVDVVAQSLASLDQCDRLEGLLSEGYQAPEEGWILGAGHDDLSTAQVAS